MGKDVATIKAVIFDLDGTLLDTESLSCRAVIESFDLIGLTIPSEIYASLNDGGLLLPWELKRQMLGLRGSEWIPKVLGYAEAEWGVEMAVSFQGGIVDTVYELEKNFYDREVMIEKLWKAWELRLNELCSQVQACAGATEIVDGLRKLNIPMAIATSSRMDSVNRKKQKHENMFRSFQHIVCGDDPCVKNGKPAPDIYLEAAKRLGVHPSECLVFEDALTGAQAGKLAGCHVVAVPDPRMEREPFLHVADEIIESLLQFSGQRCGIPLELCP